MLYRSNRRLLSIPIIKLVVLVCSGFAASHAMAFTPTDPVVQGMVNRGISYLEKSVSAKTHYPTSPATTGGLGELVLAGYAHFKVEHDPSSPVVQAGIKAAKQMIAEIPGDRKGHHANKSVYCMGIAAMLLADVGADEYHDELVRIGRYFASAQYRNGAYGYPDEPTGDTSQTQYAMLGLWTLDHKNIKVDFKGVGETIKWLLRVQDLTGGWPYQGVDPGSKGRIRQERVDPSMAVAGGSALLIAGDILRAWGDGDKDNPNIDGLPEVVKLKPLGDELARRPEIPPEPLKQSIGQSDTYLTKKSVNPDELKTLFPYYQLYTLERYESFKEIAFEAPENKSPGWYNMGVEYLQPKQADDGSWAIGGRMTPRVATSFAILFLIRSTKKAIQATQEGTLAGGRNLPGSTVEITVDGTQIKGKPVAGAVTDLLDMLEGDEGDKLEGKSLPEDMELPTDPKDRRATIDRLERLVRGSSSWQARRVAARLLAKSDEMRVVPSLIFALDDPDTKVRTFARDGLRFISRKFEGFGMEISRGEKQDYGELRKAQREWRKWYLTMDPGYIFVTD